VNRLLRTIGKFAAAAAVIVAFFLFLGRYLPTDTDSPAAELPIGGENKYYFSQLSNIEKHAYNSILSEIGRYPPRIKVPSMTEDELGSIFEALLCDNPSLYFVGRECTVRMSGSKAFFYPKYSVDKDTYAAQTSAVERAADRFLSTVSGLTDEYALELAVHDYLVSTCSYEEGSATVYDALVRGIASCEGYSKAAKYIFDRLGINCFVMCGSAENHTGETVDHMWNIVSINGGRYHLDITWDDPADAGGSSIRHTYFNLSDKEISATHTGYKCEYACDETSEGYFVKSGSFFKAYDMASKNAIANLISDAADNGEEFVEFKFSSGRAYAAADNALFGKKEIYEILEIAASGCSARILTDRASYSSDKRFNIIQIYIPYADVERD
jgi:hypothetical protein